MSYTCTECGYSCVKWLGRCPECQAWGTLEEKGATAVEYALIVGAVAAVIVAAMVVFRGKLEGLFNGINVGGSSTSPSGA